MKRVKKRVNWKVLIICLIIVYAVAFIGSIFTSQGTKTEWYQSIKPSITPPNWIFPIVWNVLFFLIGLSLYFAWISAKNKSAKKSIIILFTINFILNILWSLLYFTLQNPIVAFIDLALIWFSIIILLILTQKINKASFYLLIPYLLWVSFAGVLNFLSI